jgi:hypothetical protein
MPSGNKSLGAGRRLFGDTRLVFLLLNEVRHRIVARLFGVSRKDSNLVTIFAIGSLAGVLRAGATRLRGIRLRPSVAETAIGAAVLKETVHGIAGDRSRGTPLFAALIAFVVLEKSFGPALRGTFRGVRGSFRAVMASLRRVRVLLEGE